MQDKYCLPIIKDSCELVIDAIQKNIEQYGAFEIWLDYIKDLDDKFIHTLAKYKTKKIIVLFRRKNLEPIKMYLSKRLDIIKIAGSSNILIDLDITQIDEIKYAQQLKINKKLIVSFHDYSNTPDDIYLQKILTKIKANKPKIIKISTFCNNENDALRLLRVKKDLIEENQKHIILGMGDAGKITRVFGALWGNELIFIPVSSDEESAPGQITRAEFDKIIERINKK